MGLIIYRKKDCLYAYLAGAIDSDGFISIQKSVRKNKSSGVHEYFNAKVGFTSTSHTVIQNLLKENFGGSIYTYKPRNPQHKVWSVWQVTDRMAYAPLLSLLPYLVIKKRQAELVIEYIDVCERQRREMKIAPKQQYRITDEMFLVREHYWKLVGKLNSVNGGEACMRTMAAPHYNPATSVDQV